jgi:hypothetical protein
MRFAVSASVTAEIYNARSMTDFDIVYIYDDDDLHILLKLYTSLYRINK